MEAPEEDAEVRLLLIRSSPSFLRLIVDLSNVYSSSLSLLLLKV